MRRSFNTLKEIGRTNDMDNSNMLAMIERKMSVDDRKVWFRFQESTKDPVSLQMLLSWMSGEMKTRMRASAPLRSDSRHVTVGHMSQFKDEQPSSDAKFQQRYQQNRCWICKADDHWVDQCKKLIGKTAPERLKFIQENHACFSCLKKASRNHHMSTCRRRRQCSEQKNGVRCSYFHHPLLHTEVEIQSSGSPDENSDGNVGVASVESNEALLPVVTVDVIGQQGTVKKEANVLLDSGAQISLITDDLASELQLKGVPMNVTVRKVGGVKEVLQTHKYKVPIREVNSTGKPILITAIGIPCICENISAVNLDDLARDFKFRQQDLHRGSGAVDLLVGIDHAKLHSGEIREVGNCAARKSPVGWVVFGTMPNNTAHSHAVLHVKLTGSVVLPDCLTVETEEIKSDSCHCEQTDFTRQEVVEDELVDCKKFRCVSCRAAECKREMCEYTGPFHVKVGQNKKAKNYGVILTCLNTRAVHLELATNCSMMEILQVLRRFFAVRGQPAQILSNSGTQFVVVQREHRRKIRGWRESELTDICAEKAVQWKFVTPWCTRPKWMCRIT